MPRTTLKIQTLDPPSLHELADKVAFMAEQPGAAAAVQQWREKHGDAHPDYPTDQGRTFAVVGATLMFLHPCPDGELLPFALYPDGRVLVYTDPLHAGESFLRGAEPAESE